MPAFAASSDYLDTVEGRCGFLRETSHELIREIGGGAYGRVWLARSVTGTYRAIKVVFRSDFKSDTPFDREYRGILKFEPISRDHDGFIDILHVGRNDPVGYFYYVMELGDDAGDQSGQPFNPETYIPRTLDSERRRHQRLPFDETLRLALKLTLALGALHKAGLVHRDIKPSNIMLVGGQPKLADIGLVTDAGAEVSFVGTEGYIPPEGPGGATADIYSLGKVLYEISTGNDRMQFPELPVQLLNQGEPQNGFVEFNEILIKACDRQAANRYQSAEELHAHLALLQAGKSVRRLLELERTFQRIRRYVPLIATVMAAAGVYFFLFLRERQQKNIERQRQVSTAVSYGSRAVETGDYLGAVPWFVEGLRLDQGDAYKERTHRLRIASLLQHSPRPVQMWYFPHFRHEMRHAEFSPDNRHVLAANADGLSAIYSIETGKQISPFFGTGKHKEMASFSPDGRYIVISGDGSSKYSIWDAKSGEVKAEIRSDYGEPKTARFSPRGDRILAGSYIAGSRQRECRGIVWDALSGKELFSLPHSSMVMAVAFSADGDRIATASRDGTVGVWDAGNGGLIRRLNYPVVTPPVWVEWVALSPDGRRVAACANVKNSNAQAWDVETGQQLFPPFVHQDGVSSIEFSPDGRYLVTASWDSMIRIWDATTGKIVNPPIKQSGKATYACFSSDSKRLLTVCHDGFVTVWDLPFGESAPTSTSRHYSADGLRYLTQRRSFYDVHDAVSHRLISSVPAPAEAQLPPLFDRGGQLLVTFSVVTNQGMRPFLGVQSWRVNDGASNGPQIRTALDLTNAVLSVDGRSLALQARRRVECWDTRSGRALGAFPLITGTAKIVFNHRGDRIGLGQHDGVDIVDVQSGRFLLKAPMTLTLRTTRKMNVASLDFSPDDQLLVAAYSNDDFDRGAAQVWNVADGNPAGPVMKQRDGVLEARFSPDGSSIVTASEDFDAILWDSRTSAPLPVPPLHHNQQVLTAAFSADSRWVITGGRDKVIRIWEVQSGEPIALPIRVPDSIVMARFVAGGRQVEVRGENGAGWIWDLPEEKRPTEDLRIIAQVLSGRRATRTSSAVLQLEDVLWESWQQLRSNSAVKIELSKPDAAAAGAQQRKTNSNPAGE